MASLIHAAGWRSSWAILGGIIAVVLLPGMVSLLRDVEPLHQREVAEHKAHPPKLQLWRDAKFYLLLPGNLFIPCVLTALFLYQLPLAQYRGWSAGTMASAFIGFAVARMAASLAIGPVIDRWGACVDCVLEWLAASGAGRPRAWRNTGVMPKGLTQSRSHPCWNPRQIQD